MVELVDEVDEEFRRGEEETSSDQPSPELYRARPVRNFASGCGEENGGARRGGRDIAACTNERAMMRRRKRKRRVRGLRVCAPAAGRGKAAELQRSWNPVCLVAVKSMSVADWRSHRVRWTTGGALPVRSSHGYLNHPWSNLNPPPLSSRSPGSVEPHMSSRHRTADV